MVAGSVRLGTRRGPSSAEVDNAIDAALVLDLPWDQTCDQNAIGAGALTANVLYLARAKREPLPRTITAIEFYKAVVGDNVNVGMWSWDGTTWTLMSYSGSTAVAAGTNAWQSVPLLVPQVKQAGGDYFYGLAINGTTGTIGRASVGAANAMFRGFTAAQKASAFDIAASAASLVAADLVAPAVLIALRAV